MAASLGRPEESAAASSAFSLSLRRLDARLAHTGAGISDYAQYGGRHQPRRGSIRSFGRDPRSPIQLPRNGHVN